jgi:hypothetical protein
MDAHEDVALEEGGDDPFDGDIGLVGTKNEE